MTPVKKPKLDVDKLSDEAQALKDFLEERLVGQHRAIEKIVGAYDTYLSPLGQNDSPIISALFTGPSGVGKTYLAELLAEFFFDNRHAFTKVECENYRERHSISKLLGSPPGYVGYREKPILHQDRIDKYGIEEEQQRLDERLNKFMKDNDEFSRTIEQIEDRLSEIEFLLENVDLKEVEEDELMIEYNDLIEKKNELTDMFMEEYGNVSMPISIILFDEIEKAHGSLHNVLLEIMAKGRTTLSDGSKVDMTHSFIIMTSNAGSQEITSELKGGGLGFDSPADDSQYPVYRVAMDELKKVFPTEFLGRIEDDIVVFRHLDKSELKEVMGIYLDEIRENLDNRFPINLYVSDSAKEYILDEALDHPEYGARLIKNKVDKHVRNPLDRFINSHQIERGDKVFIQIKQGGGSLEYRTEVEV